MHRRDTGGIKAGDIQGFELPAVFKHPVHIRHIGGVKAAEIQRSEIRAVCEHIVHSNDSGGICMREIHCLSTEREKQIRAVCRENSSLLGGYNRLDCRVFAVCLYGFFAEFSAQRQNTGFCIKGTAGRCFFGNGNLRVWETVLCRGENRTEDDRTGHRCGQNASEIVLFHGNLLNVETDCVCIFPLYTII